MSGTFICFWNPSGTLSLFWTTCCAPFHNYLRVPRSDLFPILNISRIGQPDQIVILGPSRISDLAVHEIDLALDALQRGDRHIISDEDGDPRPI